jgi:hypothetical protein
VGVHQIHPLVEIHVQRHEAGVVARQRGIVDEGVEMLGVGDLVITQPAGGAVGLAAHRVVGAGGVVDRDQGVGAARHDDRRLAAEPAVRLDFADALADALRLGEQGAGERRAADRVAAGDQRPGAQGAVEGGVGEAGGG